MTVSDGGIGNVLVLEATAVVDDELKEVELGEGEGAWDCCDEDWDDKDWDDEIEEAEDLAGGR
jgi:hypothetical protein